MLLAELESIYLILFWQPLGKMLACRQTVVENKDDVCCDGASALGCFTDWGMTEGEGP